MKKRKSKKDILKERFNIEFNDDDYRKQFVLITSKLRNSTLIPEEIILEWYEFIQELEDGYLYTASEYDDEVDFFRDNIDKILFTKELKKYPNHELFQSIIGKIDNNFKELTVQANFLPKDWKWWERRVLKRAGKDYSNFINSNWGDKLGFKVETIDNF